MMQLSVMNCVSSNVPDLKTLATQKLVSYSSHSKEEDEIILEKDGHSDLLETEQLMKNGSINSMDVFDGNVNGNLNGQKENFGCFDHNVLQTMKYEIHRLHSYRGKWPLKSINPTDLANVGLFYLGYEDQVQCAFCNGIISHWEDTDIPVREHVRHFPMCPFLLGSDVGNVPLASKNGHLSWQVKNSLPERKPSSINSLKTNNLIPKHPHINNMSRRLETYQFWTSTVVGKQELAECGLFYTGTRDTVTCFCCGILLSNWEAGDDPWEEHAKHNSMCAYVRYVKGEDFIMAVRKKMASSLTPAPNCYAYPNGTLTPSQPLQNGEANGVSQVSSLSEASQNVVTEEKSKYACKICLEEEQRVLFLPCKHCVACKNCAEILDDCPLCRRKIENYIQIYLD